MSTEASSASNPIKKPTGFERRKSRFIVERNFQSRFTLKICMVAGGLVLIYGALVLFMIRLNYEMLINHALIQMPTTVETLQREFRLYSVLLVLVLVLVIAFLYGVGLLLSQKIAGPLIAVQKQLRDFGEGHTGVRLRLRQHDEFRNIETVFNFAMKSFDKRQAEEQKILEAAIRANREGHVQESERLIRNLLETRSSPKKAASDKVPIPGEILS
jgi:hypothetical protein